MTNDESALREVIEGSMAGLFAPAVPDSAAAVEQGRRLRRRRRVADVVGAAASPRCSVSGSPGHRRRRQRPRPGERLRRQ